MPVGGVTPRGAEHLAACRSGRSTMFCSCSLASARPPMSSQLDVGNGDEGFADRRGPDLGRAASKSRASTSHMFPANGRPPGGRADAGELRRNAFRPASRQSSIRSAPTKPWVHRGHVVEIALAASASGISRV